MITGEKPWEIYCKSTDDKEDYIAKTPNLPNGSYFIEIDTDDIYQYDKETKTVSKK